MTRYSLLFLLCCFTINARAQQYGLFNTKTLFDSFENPAQKSFTLDSSRQYASNFLLPYLDMSSLNKGNSIEATNNLVRNGYRRSRMGAFANPETMRENINIYLFAFKIFKYHQYHREMGFSWQLRSETVIDYDKNISSGLFDTFDRLTTIPRINIFNNNGELQTYHQISFNYRENLNKRWALGTKISLLSGIGYSYFSANRSSVVINPTTKMMDVELEGDFKLNYLDDNSISFSKFIPFKNLGASITIGTTYTSKSGIFFMANVKDLGFIRWGKKKSLQGNLNINKQFNNITNDNTLAKVMDDLGRDNGTQKAFLTPVNSRIDLLLSKTFGPYTPNLIVSKNIFNKFGEAALVNTFKWRVLSFSATPSYNLDDKFRMGLQGMIQTPNLELFMGTNDLRPSYRAGKEIVRNVKTQATGYNRASIYIGMAFKIGYVVEHPQNMSWMPKVGSDKDRKSFFRSIFKKKSN